MKLQHGGVEMRKRTFRRLSAIAITLLLVFSLSVSAAADMYSMKVTVRSGDTLFNICKANGVDYYQYKEVIMRLNGFKDEKQLDRIKAGTTIEIPASSADAAGMSQAANIKVYSSNGAIPVQHSPMNGIVAADGSKIMAGDAPAYYIVNYTLEYGDNLTDLYSAWGMDVSQYKETIKLLNALSDLNYLPAGKSLYLPSKNAGFGTVCYTVMEHKISNGDTTFEICRGYGLNYDAAQYTLQSFNPGTNFDRIGVGQKMYIPVVGTVTAQPTQTAAEQYAAYLAYVAQQQVAQPVRQTPVQQQAPVQQQSMFPAVPAAGEFNGFGVVINYGSQLKVRLENGSDVDLNVTPAALNGYYPKPGDYIKVNFVAPDMLLESTIYVYNVFTGTK